MEETINEEKTETPNDEAVAVGNPPQGDQQQSFTLIEQASNAAKRLEEANTKTEQLAERLERIAADQMLAGRAVAGIKQPTKEDEEQEEVKAVVNSFFEK